MCSLEKNIYCHKVSLNISKRTKIIWSILSDYNRIKLEIINNNISKKTSNICNLNNRLLDNSGFKKKITRQLLKHFEVNYNENTTNVYSNFI